MASASTVPEALPAFSSYGCRSLSFPASRALALLSAARQQLTPCAYHVCPRKLFTRHLQAANQGPGLSV